MYYFTEQEQAVQLFDKLASVSKEHRVIFIVAKEQRDVKPLLQDLATLLQRFPLKIDKAKGSLRIQGTTTNKAQTIIVLSGQNPDKLKGIRESQIVYA